MAGSTYNTMRFRELISPPGKGDDGFAVIRGII
jgi:hypothetical protein